MSNASIILAVKRLISLLSPKEKWQVLKMMSFSFCTSLLEMLTATSIVVLAHVLNQPESANKYLGYLGVSPLPSAQKGLLYIAIMVAIIYCIKNLLAISEVILQHFTIQRLNYRFKKKLLKQYAYLDYSYYLMRNSSQGYALIREDADLTFTNGLASLVTIFSEAIIFLALVGMIIFIEPQLALFVFGLGAIFALLVKSFFPFFYRWGQKIQHFSLLGDKHLLQFFYAFKEMVLTGKRDAFINAYHLYSRQRSKVQAMQNIANVLPRMLTELIFVGLFVTTIVYFCVHQDNPQTMLGILGGYLYAGFRLMPGLNRIITQLNTFKSIIPAINRAAQEYQFIAAKDNYVDCPDFKFEKEISLSNVSFHYPQAPYAALQEVNLKIYKGECFGIMGETGSGKSTLSDVILGLLKPQGGSVLIDGKYPLNSYQWHACIGYVHQSIYLTDDTIKANIAFGEEENEIDLERIQHAVKGAQLEALIKQLPEGLETIVGERGVRLSGGERQRIAIARALYRQPTVFIFDEATSALDNDTEARLMGTVEALRQSQRTIIIIAHRLTTLRFCDRILVMNKGKIARIISYDELQVNLPKTY